MPRGLKQALQFGQHLFRVHLSRHIGAKAAVVLLLSVFFGPLRAHLTPLFPFMRESTPDEGAIYRRRVEPFQGMSVILMTPEKLNHGRSC
ncbi:hypothetical protein DFR50_15821 [Roseiarcus fermentans]|uniref:Uncharacterized protein n=1 Tax=Roseiarcus fermentans TaxID=1473586 RepID=A0A366EFJ0_9HYPH|nr:hypothetical protein DFR50_15821 [Roseiarcus fermentans]